jgi:hypothetical protein
MPLGRIRARKNKDRQFRAECLGGLRQLFSIHQRHPEITDHTINLGIVLEQMKRLNWITG